MAQQNQLKAQQMEIAQLRKLQEQTTATLEARLARIENSHKIVRTTSAPHHQPADESARARPVVAEAIRSAPPPALGQ